MNMMNVIYGIEFPMRIASMPFQGWYHNIHLTQGDALGFRSSRFQRLLGMFPCW